MKRQPFAVYFEMRQRYDRPLVPAGHTLGVEQIGRQRFDKPGKPEGVLALEVKDEERRISLRGEIELLARCRLRLVHELGEREHFGVDPTAIRLLVGEAVLDLVVEEHAALRWIHEQHLPGAEAASNEHGRRIDIEHVSCP